MNDVVNSVPCAATFSDLGTIFGKDVPTEALAKFFDAFTLAWTKRHDNFVGDNLRVNMQLVACANLFGNLAQQQVPRHYTEKQME